MLVQWWSIKCGICIDLFCLWKMQEIHQGQCEEWKLHQGVVFCNLFITFNVKFDCVNHRIQMCKYFKSKLHVDLNTVYGVLSFYLCSPWSPLLSITPEVCAMPCLLLEVTCYVYMKKLSTIKLKLGPCHMYWGVLFCVETATTCALYNTEITVH